MHYFIKKSDDYVAEKILFKIDDECTLDQMLEQFELYLKAVGYSFNGHIEVFEDDYDNRTE